MILPSNLHTERVEHKADEPVVRCKRQEKGVGEDDMLPRKAEHDIKGKSFLTYLEVIDDGFTILEVVRDCEEVPIEGVTPRVVGAPEKNADLPVHKRLDKENQTDHIHVPYCELYYGTASEPTRSTVRITHSRTPLS
jgi:hypothetical protein